MEGTGRRQVLCLVAAAAAAEPVLSVDSRQPEDELLLQWLADCAGSMHLNQVLLPSLAVAKQESSCCSSAAAGSSI